MTDERTPVGVPGELGPLLDHRPEVLELLRGMRLGLEDASGLPVRDIELARIAAAVALGAPEATFHAHVRRAVAAGVTDDDVWGVVMAVAPLVGVPRLLASVPAIAAALEADR